MHASTRSTHSGSSTATSDIDDLKSDVRPLRDKTDAVKDSIASAKVWALVLYIALAGSLFGVLARGFGWL